MSVHDYAAAGDRGSGRGDLDDDAAEAAAGANRAAFAGRQQDRRVG